MATEIPSYTGNVPNRELDGEEAWSQNYFNLLAWIASVFTSFFNTAVTEVETNRSAVENTAAAVAQDKADITVMRDIVRDASNYFGDWLANYSTVDNPNGYPTNCAVSFNDEIYYSKVPDNQAQPTAGKSDANWFYSGRKNLVYVAKTSNYTAVDHDFIKSDATAASFTNTLPASPVANTRVLVVKTDATANTVTVDGNGKNIFLQNNIDTNLVIDMQNLIFEFVFDGTVWRVKIW